MTGQLGLFDAAAGGDGDPLADLDVERAARVLAAEAADALPGVTCPGHDRPVQVSEGLCLQCGRVPVAQEFEDAA